MPDFIGDAERLRAEKIALRTRLLAERKSKTPESLRSAARATLPTLVASIAEHSPTVIATYVPIGAEPGGPDLPEALRRVGTATVLLPVLLPGGDLDWAVYDGPAALRPGPRGLLEPAGRRLGVSAVSDAAFVVVPALAVDHRGVRMGRGGGSYDRALARVSPGTFTVALLHDGELLDTVPAEPHDRRVGAVITPSEGLSATADWTK
ncbi:5-formyltetrahydrofolate cyclo-ligase [Actinoplanes sp. N902-109]|uniref:5-formyltetrahydrofolate cyclo-ligase n=1 Tax=Actinoplanes sp. (strain N902-109) TaxID=649831 RepID=UPI0003294829|nr:5-formyltetrahydrofolate cyclo-ligase [Actinoplanes sp. N902-109]AGL21098.1 5-formyltetrahydrofolate cyclo-ligase [Actinoplanes sp. N902-109]